MPIIDSYGKFCKDHGICGQDFVKWGLDNIVYPDPVKVKQEWNALKNNIVNGSDVYVRKYGRKGNSILIDFYNFFGIKAKPDPNNNSKATKMLQTTTGYKKFNSRKQNTNGQILQNYQVSHIFGKTKNVYCFTAPWNVCFVPKLIDPLTGHESEGTFPISFKSKWMKAIKKKYQNYINEYNNLVRSFDIDSKLKKFFSNPSHSGYSQAERAKFEEDMKEEFSPIK